MPTLPAILGTVPGWITAGGVVTLLGVVLREYTANRKMTLADLTTKRREKRDELHDCQARLDATEKRLDLVEAASHSFELKLTAALIAYRIVEVAHEAASPGSMAVQQARAVFSTAFAIGELPDEISELAGRVKA